VLAPGAAGSSNFVCPIDCVAEADCERASFGCTKPNTRRFDYLFGSLSPPLEYWPQFLSLSAQKQAQTIALVYEHEATLTSEQMEGVRILVQKYGLSLVADIGIATGGSTPAHRDFLTRRLSGGTLGPDSITDQIKFSGSWQDVATPVVELINKLNVDVVIGGTSYESCVGLVKAFVASKILPKSLGVTGCVDEPELYDVLDKNLRWLSGVSIPPLRACALAVSTSRSSSNL
jgi:hypothetical protein